MTKYNESDRKTNHGTRLFRLLIPARFQAAEVVEPTLCALTHPALLAATTVAWEEDGKTHLVQVGMRHCARELFLLSRPFGAVGLDSQSATLSELARRVSNQRERNAIDFKAYAVMSKYLGRYRTGLLSLHFGRLRHFRKGLGALKKLENLAR
jgi:hypothetical protein